MRTNKEIHPTARAFIFEHGSVSENEGRIHLARFSQASGTIPETGGV
jgi:hypothetical protein